ncbi:hypothetical protein CB1_007347004 [Camelus ferus]|nr:hypothetical protein CB1_007347004 [Camelus ferus]
MPQLLFRLKQPSLQWIDTGFMGPCVMGKCSSVSVFQSEPMRYTFFFDLAWRLRMNFPYFYVVASVILNVRLQRSVTHNARILIAAEHCLFLDSADKLLRISTEARQPATANFFPRTQHVPRPPRSCGRCVPWAGLQQGIRATGVSTGELSGQSIRTHQQQQLTLISLSEEHSSVQHETLGGQLAHVGSFTTFNISVSRPCLLVAHSATCTDTLVPVLCRSQAVPGMRKGHKTLI